MFGLRPIKVFLNTPSSESKGSVGNIFDLYGCSSSKKIPDGLQNSKRPPPQLPSKPPTMPSRPPAPSPPNVGLNNVQNSCWANAIAQVVTHNPFVQEVLTFQAHHWTALPTRCTAQIRTALTKFSKPFPTSYITFPMLLPPKL